MTKNSSTLLLGVLAGLATALLALSGGSSIGMSLFVSCCVALPILIASLGWGDVAGVTSVFVACLIIALGLSPLFALLFLLVSFGPAAWVGHLANLARPAEEVGGASGSLAWYPLSVIMLQLTGLVTLGLIVFGAVVGYGPGLIGHAIDSFVHFFQQQDPSYQPSSAAIAQMKAIALYTFPASSGALWVAILFATFYVAGALVRLSGRGHRPRDDIPTALRMPRLALPAFAIGLALVFFGGIPAFIGAVICGAFGISFVLAGFAVLHERTRGLAWRFAALWLAYVAVVLFTIPLVFFFFAGLLDTAGLIPARPSGPHDKKR